MFRQLADKRGKLVRETWPRTLLGEPRGSGLILIDRTLMQRFLSRSQKPLPIL